MGRTRRNLFLIPLCLALLFSSSLAELEENIRGRQSGKRSKHGGGRGWGDCQINNLNAIEPTRQVKSEAGLSEHWDDNEEQLQCAGVSVSRHTVQPNGLLLPSYSNSPRLIYVVEGTGTGGIVVPGCPESFSSFSTSRQSSQERGKSREGRQSSQGDEHQRVQRLRRGDVVAVPAGVAHWFYNDGESQFVAISVMDLNNYNNQLDNYPRRFFLAGSFTSSRGGGSTGRRTGEESYQSGQNIFKGFDTRIISEVFGVSEDTARKLQGEGEQQQQDQRGHIVRVEGRLEIASPRGRSHEERRSSRSSPSRRGGSQWEEERGQGSSRGGSQWEEERGQGRSRGGRGGGSFDDEVVGSGSNGVDEAFCYAKFRINIGDPQKADVFSQEAGHLTTLTSSKLPILNLLQLSAERGHLRRNAILAPHWNINAHSIVYAIEGSAQVQIVDNSGEAIFDGHLKEGQLLVVPQNFVVVKKAEEQDFHWISFKTNGWAVSSSLAGKTSVLRGLPEDVLRNSYQISSKEARRIKYGRDEETMVLNPWSSSSSRRAVA